MHHIFSVHILDCRKSLTEKFISLCFTNGWMLVLIGKKRALICQFHDHVHCIFFNKSIPQFNNVRMIKLSVHIYLSFKQHELSLCHIGSKLYLNIFMHTTLTAKHLLVSICRPSRTVPKEPTPICLIKLN